MARNLVGNSLSMCVKEIMKGNVKLEDVRVIISGTRFITCQEMLSYFETEASKAIAKKLWEEGKLVQSKKELDGMESPYFMFWNNDPCIGAVKGHFFGTYEEWTGENVMPDSDAAKHNRWIISQLQKKGLID